MDRQTGILNATKVSYIGSAPLPVQPPAGRYCESSDWKFQNPLMPVSVWNAMDFQPCQPTSEAEVPLGQNGTKETRLTSVTWPKMATTTKATGQDAWSCDPELCCAQPEAALPAPAETLQRSRRTTLRQQRDCWPSQPCMMLSHSTGATLQQRPFKPTFTG